jgi:hypothetical protein
MTLNEIVEQFKEKAELLRKNEVASVPLIIDQARIMVQLRTKARKNWEEVCEQKLKIHPRVARRYLKIGENWSDADRTPGSDVLARLPSDLHKLEALAELPLDLLTTLSGQLDLRRMERTEVIAKVKGMMGKGEGQHSEADPVLAVFNKWDSFAARLVKEVEGLDGAGRQRFGEELEDLMQQLQEALDKALEPSPPEGRGEEAGQEEQEEAEGEPDEGEGPEGEEEEPETAEAETPEEEEEEPAPKASATKGGRPATKPRPKP